MTASGARSDDQPAQGGRFPGAQRGDLGVRPMTGDMVGKPLQALGVAAHHQQNWTGRVCHR